MCEDEQQVDLAATFTAYRNQLHQLAAKILRNSDRAEDVVQDAYLKIIEVKAVLVVKQPVAYIFRVVRNLAIDHYRHASLESSLFTGDEEAQSMPSPAPTPEAISISRQQISLVADALDQLPKRTRRAFELYRVGGHTQREIAQMLGVSPTLVNFMIRDALNRCRSVFDSTAWPSTPNTG